MKFFLVFFLLPIFIFSKNSVNWKPYKKNVNKPIFILLTDDLNSKADKKIFSTERLADLINKKFYPIKIDVNEKIDFKNRFLLMTPPSIAVLSPSGVIYIKKRNYTPLTIERDLYNYLESEKNKSLKRMMDKISSMAMFNTYFPAYFLKNPKVLINRSEEVYNFILKNIDYKKYFFNVSFLKPLYDYCFSVFKMNKVPFLEKLIAYSHVDILLNSKIFEKNHIYKGAYGSWNRPIKKIIIQDNLKFLELLLILKSDKSSDLISYIDNNYEKLKSAEKLYYKTLLYEYGIKDTSSEIISLIEKVKNSEYLVYRMKVLKAYEVLYRNKKISKSVLISFIDMFEKDFYDEEKGIFYDVKKGSEPFGFKYVDTVANINLAYLYTELYKITANPDNLVTATYILSFMNTTSIDNLVYSKYLIAIENLLSFPNLKNILLPY